MNPEDVLRADVARHHLTAPQAKVLWEVRAAASKTYNGRARRTVEALEKAGLVVVARDSIPQAKGNGIELVSRLTVRAVLPPPRPVRQFWRSKRMRPGEEDYPRDANGWHF